MDVEPELLRLVVFHRFCLRPDVESYPQVSVQLSVVPRMMAVAGVCTKQKRRRANSGYENEKLRWNTAVTQGVRLL